MVLICISLLISGVEHLLCAGWPSVISSLENVCSGPWPHFDQVGCWFVMCCMSSLCFLSINPLLDILLANISSHLVDCLFVLLRTCFTL